MASVGRAFNKQLVVADNNSSNSSSSSRSSSMMSGRSLFSSFFVFVAVALCCVIHSNASTATGGARGGGPLAGFRDAVLSTHHARSNAIVRRRHRSVRLREGRWGVSDKGSIVWSEGGEYLTFVGVAGRYVMRVEGVVSRSCFSNVSCTTGMTKAAVWSSSCKLSSRSTYAMLTRLASQTTRASSKFP